MLAQALLAGLLLGAPETKISYKKKVMLDPAYKPAMTAEKIDEVLREARAPKRVATPVSVYRETRLVERRRRWHIPVRIGFDLGYHWGHRRRGWHYGVGLHWPYYGRWYDGLGIHLGYRWGHGHRHHRRYRWR
jgi:hypothetical protein